MNIYLGIDWSETKHDLAFVNEAGALVSREVIPHNQEGFRKLTERCAKLQVAPAHCAVGIETKHNLLVDFLWSYGYSQVYVIPPSLVKGSRLRYGNSGARTDVSDAYVLADIVRTDRGRLTLWKPDQPLTRQLRATVTQVHQLTQTCVQLSHQLRALLLRYYPGALAMFPNLQAQTALAFIVKYPTPVAATKLTATDFEAFLAAHRYSHRKHATAKLSVLQQPALLAEDSTVDVYEGSATRLATLLLQSVQLKAATQKELTSLFEQHPDHDIFASLPGTGAFLAPALLSKFGDDRQRFPAPAALQALAGTCPVTQQSGKHRSVLFRQACDHDFRNYAQQWAIASVNAAHSPFACAYYESLRQRHIDENHAYRCLANRWLAVACRLWHSHRTYDEAYHLLQRAQRSQPVSALLA